MLTCWIHGKKIVYPKSYWSIFQILEISYFMDKKCRFLHEKSILLKLIWVNFRVSLIHIVCFEMLLLISCQTKDIFAGES